MSKRKAGEVDDADILDVFGRGKSKKAKIGEAFDDMDPFSSEDDSSSEDEFEDPYDEDLYKRDDPTDRRKLAEMPEVAREEELAKRYEERKLAKERKEQRQKLKESRRRKRRQEAKSAQLRKSARSSRSQKSKGKSQQIAELKKLRKKGGKRVVSSDEESDHSTEEEIEEEDDEDQIDEIEDDEDYDDEREDGKRSDEEMEDVGGEEEEEEEEEEGRERQKVDQSDIKRIFLKRSRIEKWVNEPYFDEIAPGFFVRIALGLGAGQRRYRLAQISKITEGRSTYSMGSKQTRQRVRLSIGKSEKEFSLALISNQPFTEAEYSSWIDTLSSEGAPLLSKKRVEEVFSKFEIAKNYVYKPEVIKQMVEYKGKLKRVPVNITASVTELKNKREMLVGKGGGDGKEISKIDSQVKALEEILQKRYQEELEARKIEAMKRINEKNRLENQTKFGGEQDFQDPRIPEIHRRSTRPTSFQLILSAKETEKPETNETKKKEIPQVQPPPEETETDFLAEVANYPPLKPPKNYAKFMRQVHDFSVNVDLSSLEKNLDKMPLPPALFKKIV